MLETDADFFSHQRHLAAHVVAGDLGIAGRWRQHACQH